MPSCSKHAAHGVPGELSDKSAPHAGHGRLDGGVAGGLSGLIAMCRQVEEIALHTQQKNFSDLVTSQAGNFSKYSSARLPNEILRLAPENIEQLFDFCINFLGIRQRSFDF